ncbi:MAG: ABC transporter ATP-binding protein [Clostridiales bacterium]|nr:ABC transporter ATP-binding protein [Clostridiales bacterium]
MSESKAPQSNAAPQQRRGPMIGPGMMGRGPAEKPKDFKKTMRTLITYLAPYKTKIIAVILIAIVSTVFSIVGPKLLGKVTTKLVEGLLAYISGTGLYTDFAYMGRIIAWLIGLYVLSAACTFLQGFIMAKVSNNVTYDLRRAISEKMNRLPLKYYDTRTHGEVLSHITNDVDLINQSLSQSLTQLVTSATMILGILAMMLSINVFMTLLALFVLPLSTVVVLGIVKKSQVFFAAQQKHLGELNGHVEEMYSGHNIVQAFNGEAESLKKFEETNSKLRNVAVKSQFFTGIMMPAMNAIGNLGYVAVCILGGYLAVKKVVEIGDIQSFIQYMRSFTQPISQLSSISNTLQSTSAAAERVFAFLDQAEETADTPAENTAMATRGAVRFEHVRFGYDPETIIIKDFSADVTPGQKIAIVGPTGAGKTTIVKLLMRFYDINSGHIRIDGEDIQNYTRNDLRAHFGMVLQDTWLYNGTILENIRYGTFDATDEQVIAAAKAARCHEFIQALPGGYQMELNEEASNLSQGQKQLLTIARVVLSDPKILILDEATSSVDTRTEILIQSAMDTLMHGRTSFIIAHRLSTIKNADLILVMRDGDIVEQGNHADLLAANGFYADLYNSQFNPE